jgi:effector-binding domain-containing protein
MPRISDFELLKTPDQPALCIRTRTPVDGLPAIIGQSYGRLGAYLASLGGHLAGVPFVAYHNMDMADLDVEMGFPVASQLPGSGDIRYAPVPGGLRAFCMYQGAYGQMAPVYGELAEWIGRHGFVPVGTAYEYYFNGPDFPEEQLLTQIVMPLK